MESQGKPLRILLADYDSMSRAITVLMIESCGCEVVAVADGRSAVAAAGREPFALVILDITMPVMDGFGALGLIRKLDRPGDCLPVVAMTGHADPGDRERFLELGFDDYLPKPIDLKSLGLAIARNARSVS